MTFLAGAIAAVLVTFFAAGAAAVGSAAVRRGRAIAAVVSYSLPRSVATVANTAGPSDRVDARTGVLAPALDAPLSFFLGGILVYVLS